MKQGLFTVAGNEPLTGKVHRLILRGDCTAIRAPGQFVTLSLPGFFLRRPFSLCDWTEDSLTLLVEKAGKGTDHLLSLPLGTELDALTGLGNGFDLSAAGDSPLLIGGGTGLSPLYALTKALLARGIFPTVILGFNTKADVFYESEFRALGCQVLVTTADGSYGIPGFVTEAMDRPHSSFYACGPEAMLRAVCDRSPMGGQISLDRRMGCGFGACMGCTVMTRSGPRRICKDGPVLKKEELLWDA